MMKSGQVGDFSNIKRIAGLVGINYKVSQFGDRNVGLNAMVALFSRISSLTMTEKIAEDTHARKLTTAIIQRVQEWQSLNALLTAVDKKDHYTRFHSEDVLYYTILLTQQLSLSETELDALYTAALLHDVGKIGISNAILQAPRALLPEEMLRMRQHPVLGASVISLLHGPTEVVAAIRHHHEAWDGAGYPDGLSGEDIPKMARILAVADTYSALINDRPYRNGVSPSEALAILEAGAGQQWDPLYVTAFLRACHLPKFH